MPSGHHRTTFSGYIFAIKANFGPLTAEIGLSDWGTPANFNRFRILASLLQRRRTPEANQTLHVLWSSPELAHYIYIFGGFCPPDTLCVQVLRSPILAALLHGTPAAGFSQSLRCATLDGITELSQMAAPMFGRAAFRLGISPHSNLTYTSVSVYKYFYLLLNFTYSFITLHLKSIATCIDKPRYRI